MNDQDFVFRSYTAEDVPFVMNSWAKSFYTGCKSHQHISPDEFHAFHRPIRERFFSKPNTAVIVCTPPEDRWLIMGWIAVEQIPSGLILQYLYVKSAFKCQGIAAELIRRALPSNPVFYTHLTERAARIMSKKHAKFSAFKHIPHLV